MPCSRDNFHSVRSRTETFTSENRFSEFYRPCVLCCDLIHACGCSELGVKLCTHMNYTEVQRSRSRF